VAAAIAVEKFQGANVRLLRQILRVGLPAGDPAGEVVGRTEVRQHQRLEPRVLVGMVHDGVDTSARRFIPSQKNWNKPDLLPVWMGERRIFREGVRGKS